MESPEVNYVKVKVPLFLKNKVMDLIQDQPICLLMVSKVLLICTEYPCSAPLLDFLIETSKDISLQFFYACHLLSVSISHREKCVTYTQGQQQNFTSQLHL